MHLQQLLNPVANPAPTLCVLFQQFLDDYVRDVLHHLNGARHRQAARHQLSILHLLVPSGREGGGESGGGMRKQIRRALCGVVHGPCCTG